VYPLGQWSARHYKRAFIAVSDFAAGYDCEAAFERGFTEGGGTIVGKVRMPLANPDFVPFMQRVKDSNPEILFSFIPAGVQTTQVMKAFGDLGLGKAGIRFLGTGDIVDDEQLPKMGDIPVGVISAHHYSTAGERPANTAFLKAWHEAYGPDAVPDFIAVAGYDGMDAIYTAIREQDGRIDPERSMAILRNYRNPDSPRGSISIDSKTRDIVQNIYIRETRKTPRGVANVEIETLPDMADPWKRIFGKE
jgi:branched-chain amino acid transport system substrate-binding protein